MKPLLLILSLVTLLAGCRWQESVSSLAGSYYRGDHTGYNIYLDLLTNGAYKAEWYGCLGSYGKAGGTWSVTGDRVVFVPSTETDMMKGHLKELHIVHQHGQVMFVPNLQDEYYKKYGADEYSAFQRKQK